MARANKIWLSLGGLHEKDPSSTDSRLFNAHLIVNSEGEIVSIYRKVHLFNLDIPGTRLLESEFSQPGNAVIKPVSTPAGNIGMGICYDLRFPEFAISMAKAGAQILTVSLKCSKFFKVLLILNIFKKYPSSFTVPTGKAHWEILLRSRAIETQCYVVAAGQVGSHNSKRSSYGNSMIIDPWGVVLAHISKDEPGYAIAEVDFDHLTNVRKRLPVWTDRKPELYGEIIPAHVEYGKSSNDETVFHFGDKTIVQPYQIFARTPLSVGFVNHRPVLPGHMLVSPLRANTKRLSTLTQTEISDLFFLVQKVQSAVEKIYGAGSSTIAIQDGIDAGQSIEHVHVHIVPRKSSDFGGNVDEIYARLQQHDKKDNAFNLRLLSIDEMTQQSKILRENL